MWLANAWALDFSSGFRLLQNCCAPSFISPSASLMTNHECISRNFGISAARLLPALAMSASYSRCHDANAVLTPPTYRGSSP